MHERTSIALTRSMAYHPGVQHEVAEMRITLEAIDAHLEHVWSTTGRTASTTAWSGR